MAPAYAVPRLLARHGLSLQDFDFYEIHEAFAAQVLCTLRAWEDPVFCSERLGLDAPLGSGAPGERIRLASIEPQVGLFDPPTYRTPVLTDAAASACASAPFEERFADGLLGLEKDWQAACACRRIRASRRSKPPRRRNRPLPKRPSA